MTDNFDFKFIEMFRGYVSSVDKTSLTPQCCIRGSKNVYKKRSGTIANRPGRKLRGSVDDEEVGITSSYVWNPNFGDTRPLRVKRETLAGDDAKLQVEFEGEWIDMYEITTLVNPALSKSRFVFATAWNNIELKDFLLMVRGTPDVLYWSGGITRINPSSVTTQLNAISGQNSATIANAGTGYSAGEILTLAGGTGGKIRVTKIAVSTAISAYEVLALGEGYSITTVASTSDGSGTGATFNILSVSTKYSLTKLDTTTTWIDDGFQSGFNSTNVFNKKIVINGTEYLYVYGEDTATISGMNSDPSGEASESIAIQPVVISSDNPNDNVNNDFIIVEGNQAFVGGYSSRTIYFSSDSFVLDSDNSSYASDGFLDFENGGSHVTGDPDFTFLDDNANGLIGRRGKVYASAGSGDWYEITPNFAPPISFTDSKDGQSRFVMPKVEKKAGTGLSGLLAHEFAVVYGDNIIYVGKDHQVRSIGAFNNIEGSQFPILSQDVYDELTEEDLTGGHLKAIADIIYLTSPVNGRHWMYQIRTSVNNDGLIVSEKLWHPPQVSGFSRIDEIDGIEYGHSNSNPQLYQIWNTGQWYDDIPNGDENEEGSYDCVLRMAYRRLHVEKRSIENVDFDAVCYIGYIEEGTELRGNVYYDYQGATAIEPVIINMDAEDDADADDDVDEQAVLFQGNSIPIGQSSLGANPMGDGLLPEADDQELLSKFFRICDVPSNSVFEYCLEVYSQKARSRWEMLDLGANHVQSTGEPTFIRK